MKTKKRVNKFGCEIGIPRNKKNLTERCKILREGIEAGTWRGEKLKRAKYQLCHYRHHLKALKAEGSTKHAKRAS